MKITVFWVITLYTLETADLFELIDWGDKTLVLTDQFMHYLSYMASYQNRQKDFILWDMKLIIDQNYIWKYEMFIVKTSYKTIEISYQELKQSKYGKFRMF
jgi:hypothetical protein